MSTILLPLRKAWRQPGVRDFYGALQADVFFATSSSLLHPCGGGCVTIATEAILPEAAPHVRAVRICAIINLTAIGSVLSWAIAETLDPLLVFTGYWFLFLILLLLPYGAIIWLIDTGRPRNGLILAGAWGPVAAFAPLSWSVVSPNIGHYWTPSPPGMFLL